MAGQPTERPKPEGCECCEFMTADLTLYVSHRVIKKPGDESKWLCKLCANSEVGAASEYPENHNLDALFVMKHVCFVGNMIIEHHRQWAERFGS